MERTLSQAEQDADLDVLRATIPFRDAPDALLRAVAGVARRARYAAGERV